MLTTMRQYALVGAVLAATGIAAAAPLVPRSSQLRVLSTQVRLLDSDSVLNIPVNLFDDIVNIPANEVQGLDTAAGSLFFNDNIFVVGAANLFGIDPGDPTHVAAIDSLFAPFPALTDGYGGLNYEITGVLASELPTSLSCAVTTCYPIVPPDVVTGITGIDRELGFAQALSDPNFGLFRNWFRGSAHRSRQPVDRVLLRPRRRRQHRQRAGLSGFGFDNQPDGNYFLGGTVDPVTGAPAYDPTTGGLDPNATEVPWAGHTFTLNLLQPLDNFYNSLLATPSTAACSAPASSLSP